MNQLESDFFSQYKSTDNLVRDALGTETGITSYINEMADKSIAGLYVDGWDNSLKTLKHLRWLRNQLAHDDTESVDVTKEDVEALKNFHSLVLKNEDPLTQYEKLVKKQQVAKVASSSKSQKTKSEVSKATTSSPKTSKTAASKPKASHSAAKKATKKKRSLGKTVLAVFFILVALFLIYLLIKASF